MICKVDKKNTRKTESVKAKGIIFTDSSHATKNGKTQSTIHDSTRPDILHCKLSLTAHATAIVHQNTIIKLNSHLKKNWKSLTHFTCHCHLLGHRSLTEYGEQCEHDPQGRHVGASVAWGLARRRRRSRPPSEWGGAESSPPAPEHSDLLNQAQILIRPRDHRERMGWRLLSGIFVLYVVNVNTL